MLYRTVSNSVTILISLSTDVSVEAPRKRLHIMEGAAQDSRLITCITDPSPDCDPSMSQLMLFNNKNSLLPLDFLQEAATIIGDQLCDSIRFREKNGYRISTSLVVYFFDKNCNRIIRWEFVTEPVIFPAPPWGLSGRQLRDRFAHYVCETQMPIHCKQIQDYSKPKHITYLHIQSLYVRFHK